MPTHLLDTDADIDALLGRIRRVVVLGIKPERDADKPAHYVPKALQTMGLTIVPVPTHRFGQAEILGCSVVDRLEDVTSPVDLVDVFRRPADLPAHPPALLAVKPGAVWFQSGIRHEGVARALAAAGIDVVQDRCLMVEYRHHLARRGSPTR